MSLLIFVRPEVLEKIFTTIVQNGINTDIRKLAGMSSLEADTPMLYSLLSIIPPFFASIWVFRANESESSGQQVIRSLKTNPSDAFERYPAFFRFVCVPGSGDLCDMFNQYGGEIEHYSQHAKSDSIVLVAIINCIFITFRLWRLVFRFLIRATFNIVRFPFRAMCCCLLTPFRLLKRSGDWIFRILKRFGNWSFRLLKRFWKCSKFKLTRFFRWLSKKCCCEGKRLHHSEQEPLLGVAGGARSEHFSVRATPGVSEEDDTQEADDNDSTVSFGTKIRRILANLEKGSIRTYVPDFDSTEDDEEDNLIDYQDSLKPWREEMERSRIAFEAHRKELEKIEQQEPDLLRKCREEGIRNEKRNATLRREQQAEFDRKKAEINARYDAEIRERREERARIERENEEEIKRIRMEAAERMQAFLTCCMLKLRFEEQEDNCRRMLDGFRKPLVKVATSFYDLQSAIQRVKKTTSEGWEREEMQSSGREYARKVANAQFVLGNGFEHLAQLAEQQPDRIFLRMIMKALSKIGSNCDSLGQQLVQVMDDSDTIRIEDLKKAVERVSPHLIPSTAQLREHSKTARNEDYANIYPVPFPDWFSFFQ